MKLFQRATTCDRTLQHHITAEAIVRRMYSMRNENCLRFAPGYHDYTALKWRTVTVGLKFTSYSGNPSKNLHETQQKLMKC